MFAAVQSFFDQNQFGKTYSEIDQEEAAALELQAQASTATSSMQFDKAYCLNQLTTSQSKDCQSDAILRNSNPTALAISKHSGT